MADILQTLIDKMEDELGPVEINSWKDILTHLENEGFLDYDVMKELLLYPEEE